MITGFLMTDFRPIRLSDRDWIERCRDVKLHPFSALSFQSLFTWQKDYGLTIAGDEDFFVVKSVSDGGYYVPCGDEKKCTAFLREAFRQEGSQRVLYLTEEQAVKAETEGYKRRAAPNLSEYICSTRALALREGHVSATYRKKYRRFAEEFSYTVKKIEREDIDELLAVIDSWEKNLDGSEPLDLGPTRLSLENFEALHLTGIRIRTEEGLTAFSFGFRSAPDIYTMSSVKYDKRLSPAVTVVCTREEAERIAQPCSFCNLEEDLGLPGLRDAKRQCSPVRLQEVFIIEK